MRERGYYWVKDTVRGWIIAQWAEHPMATPEFIDEAARAWWEPADELPGKDSDYEMIGERIIR